MSERQWFEVKGRTFFAIAIPKPRPYGGLGREVWLRTDSLPPRLPFGWKYLRVWHRSVLQAVPIWAYWPIILWQRRWAVVEPLIWCGLWQMAEEGGYYNEGHFTLRIWTSFARMRSWHPRLSRSELPGPINRWERFGWWLEARATDFNDRMPRWS